VGHSLHPTIKAFVGVEILIVFVRKNEKKQILTADYTEKIQEKYQKQPFFHIFYGFPPARE